MNKKGNWSLPAILGISGVVLIVSPFLIGLSKWFILLGAVFLWLALKSHGR